MIFSENRFALFRIMLYRLNPPLGSGAGKAPPDCCVVWVCWAGAAGCACWSSAGGAVVRRRT
ncbi:hypothetical protein, partial [Bradyrhizobium brasilense]|uniref:hypothetical protein n=1 Tax=Bradyrhizobium brasilense TaxID=1419277 RepID=UPI001E53F5BC